MPHMAREKVILEPGLARIGSPVDGKPPTVVQNIVYGLKPQIRQIPRVNTMNFHSLSIRFFPDLQIQKGCDSALLFWVYFRFFNSAEGAATFKIAQRF
jgi:hypothetical protein